MTADEYLDITQVAARLHVRERVIARYVEIGAIPYRKIGKAVRFRWSDVQAWFEALPGAHPMRNNSAQFPAPSPEETRPNTLPDETTRPPIVLARGPRGRHRLTSTGTDTR